MSKDVRKKLLFVLLAIAVMLVIGFVPAETEAMSRTAWQYLGIFGLMLVLLITAALPDWATCLAVLALLVVFKIGTVSEVMSQFGSSTVWLVIGIFTLSIGLNNSGFLKRIALWIVTKFPGTYRGQVTAMFVSGLITAPLIPSSLAKTGVLSPLTAQVSEASGIEPSSKPALGIWTACFMPTYYFGCAFMSGSAYVALMIGFMGGMEFTWGSWFSALWPWLVVSIVLTYLFCSVICKPKQTTATFSTEFIKEQYKALGPMSKKEKQGIVILLVCLILWLTQSVHKIDAGMVALLGSAAMAFCGLITTPDLCAKGQWNLIIFIGALLGFSSFMSSTGASTWIAGLLGPIISPIISSPYIFVPCLCIITFLLRHVIVSQLCCLAIMLAIFGPLLPDAGISMFVLVLVEYMSGMIWNRLHEPRKRCGHQDGRRQVCHLRGFQKDQLPLHGMLPNRLYPQRPRVAGSRPLLIKNKNLWIGSNPDPQKPKYPMSLLWRQINGKQLCCRY